MGQKIHPEGFRVGYIHDWKSNWFNEKDFADYLAEDIAIREHIEGKLSHAGLSSISIKKGSGESLPVKVTSSSPSGTCLGKLRTVWAACQRVNSVIEARRSNRGSGRWA